MTTEEKVEELRHNLITFVEEVMAQTKRDGEMVDNIMSILTTHGEGFKTMQSISDNVVTMLQEEERFRIRLTTRMDAIESRLSALEARFSQEMESSDQQSDNPDDPKPIIYF
jgi:hypothetical protein